MNEWLLYAVLIYQDGSFQPIMDMYPTQVACKLSGEMLTSSYKDTSTTTYMKCIHIGKYVDDGRKSDS